MEEQALLDEMVRRLVAAGNPQKIVLFGSRARGDAAPESDYDLLLVEPSSEPSYRRSVRYYDALADYLVPLDLLVCTPREVAEHSGLPQSFVTTALREGRVLYEAQG